MSTLLRCKWANVTWIVKTSVVHWVLCIILSLIAGVILEKVHCILLFPKCFSCHVTTSGASASLFPCDSAPTMSLGKHLFVWSGQREGVGGGDTEQIKQHGGDGSFRGGVVIPRFMERHFTKCMHPVIKTPPCLQQACTLPNIPHLHPLQFPPLCSPFPAE